MMRSFSGFNYVICVLIALRQTNSICNNRNLVTMNVYDLSASHGIAVAFFLEVLLLKFLSLLYVNFVSARNWFRDIEHCLIIYFLLSVSFETLNLTSRCWTDIGR